MKNYLISCKKLTDFGIINQMIEFVTGTDTSNYTPTQAYKHEHSLIRSQQFYFELEVPTFVATHLVRHSQVGQFWYVESKREDVTSDTKEATRSTRVRVACILNAKHLIDIARFRLCSRASTETTDCFKEMMEAVRVIDPALSYYLVPNCYYRGGICPEPGSCKVYRSFDYSSYKDLYK